MRNLHNYILENYGREALQELQQWEKWELRHSDYSNHRRFTLRCIGRDIVLVSLKLWSTNGNISYGARKIIQKAEKQILQDRVKCINVILWDNEGKLDRCRSRLLSLATTTTSKDRCIEFINKVREARFIKIKNRQVKKFNKLVAKSGREISTQSVNNNNQPWSSSNNNNQTQSHNTNNKWVINLSDISLTPAQESLLAKGPNFAVASKNP